MPWKSMSLIESIKAFIQHVETSLDSFAESCRLYGISRKTGYKWLNRYRAEGDAGLENRSTRPLSLGPRKV